MSQTLRLTHRLKEMWTLERNAKCSLQTCFAEILKDQGKNGAGAIQFDMWDFCCVFEKSIRMVEVHQRKLSPGALINSQY